VHIAKRIPSGAGLGGGSSDAATALAVLNRRFGTPLDRCGLMRLGARIGADVPFFLYGRPALAQGIGDRLSPYGGLTPLALLLVFPGRPLATAAVYKNLRFGLTKKEKLNKDSTFRDRIFKPERDLFNDLEPPAMAMEPEIAVVKTALLRHGARGALMSGSGSSVFGIFKDPTAARRAKHRLGRRNGWIVMETGLLVENSR
jgi:4-diphosphocytidyl-2-C-methyl-D-erythritol kinase